MDFLSLVTLGQWLLLKNHGSFFPFIEITLSWQKNPKKVQDFAKKTPAIRKRGNEGTNQTPVFS